MRAGAIQEAAQCLGLDQWKQSKCEMTARVSRTLAWRSGRAHLGPSVLAFQPLCKFRKTAYRRARFLFGDSKLVHLLQVQPEFGAGPEEMRQAKCTVSCDRPLAVQDSGDPVGRHLELPAKLGSAHAKFLELFGEAFAGMNGGACHALFPQ